MAKKSIKHLQIDKSQTNMLVVIILTTAFVVFGLFATKALVTKGLYQKRALTSLRKASTDLKTNYDSAQTLLTQYRVFASANPNLLGANADGSGSLDGPNPRLVLDALPSLYDAPALGTSIEKILTDQNITINSLIITDDPSLNSDKAEANPKVKTVSFSTTGTSTFQGHSKFFQALERSIRPFNVTKLDITGTDSSLKVAAEVDTYFQPAKSLDLTVTKEVK